ncbi:MAG: hypothetical protein ABIN61_07165 [candidate division WOR-3 bacterium]
MYNINIFLRFLIAHLVINLSFEFCGLRKKVEKEIFSSIWLYIFSAIYGILLYLSKGDYHTFWLIPLGFLIWVFTSLLFRFIKGKLLKFLIPQAIFLLFLFTIWLSLSKTNLSLLLTILQILFNSRSSLLIISGFISLIWPIGPLIGIITEPLREKIKEGNGLEKAGLWIGILERILIYTFILTDNLMAIAFLITAKTIFRFGEIKDHTRRKEAEYILIGTLLSFTFAILISLFIKYLLKSNFI